VLLLLADAGQSTVSSSSLGVHTFVHRLCMCTVAVDKDGETGLARAGLFLFSQVRAGFRHHRPEAETLGTVTGKLTAGSRERC
jgi:hypothetical protein